MGRVLEGDDWSGCDCGTGDLSVEDVDGIESVVDEIAVGAVDLDVDEEEPDGVSNSTGFVRGVACTLVINFALEQ